MESKIQSLEEFILIIFWASNATSRKLHFIGNGLLFVILFLSITGEKSIPHYLWSNEMDMALLGLAFLFFLKKNKTCNF